MKKLLLYLIIGFIPFLISGNTNLVLENSGVEKDSLDTSPSSDSLYLARLQNSLHQGSSIFGIRKNPLISSGNVDTTLTTKASREALTISKKFRSFPTLDHVVEKKEDFMVPMAARAPEFTPSFIASNFPKNPKVDELIKEAKAAFDKIKELQNFAEIISGKELLELPVGLSKKDSTSGNRVELAITEVKFLPKFAEFKAWARLIIPVKSADGTKPSRELFFGAEGIKLSKEGAIIGDMKLVLLGEQAIPINGDNWLLTLKGDIDLKTGTFGEKSYVEFDCSGLKSIGLEGDLRVSRNVLLPIDDDGNYVCGDSKENQYTKIKDKTVIDNKCYVGTSFSVKANGWNDILLEISLPRFEVVGFEGWGFHIEQAVLDLSDSRNADKITFPEEYKGIFAGSDFTLWRGVYAREVEVLLPQGIEKKEAGNRRVRFGAEDLVIDSYGVSGSFYATNVLKMGEGAAGKWGFSIDSIGVTLSVNNLKGGVLKGDLAVPLMEAPMGYKGWIAPEEYGLAVELKKEYKSPVFLGKMRLEKNSSVSVKVKDKKVYPYANLNGSLSLLGKVGQKEGDATLDIETPENIPEEDKGKTFSIKGITFQELELQTEPGKPFIQARKFGYEGEMNLMLFPASIKDLKMITPTADQVGLAFDLTINLDKQGSYATTGMEIIGKLPQDSPIHQWKFHKVNLKKVKIDYENKGIKLEGGLEAMDNDPVYGDGFSGELTANFKKLKFTAQAKAMFGAKDFRYWFVDIWTDSNKDAKRKKLNIDAFVGGLSNRMRKESGNADGWTPSKAKYIPDAKMGLGLRAGVQISAKNKDAFSGKAYLEMQFNARGGLSRIGFTGEGTMMSKDKSSNPVSKSVLTKFEKKINDFVDKNKKEIAKLLEAGNYLGISKEAIPQRDIASQGKVGIYIGIQRDLDRDTFDGTFELYLSTKGLRGGGTDNLAGMVKLHTSPQDWYIYVGTPTQRISLVFEVGTEAFEIGGYFMTGTKLPGQIPPHERVLQILGDDILDGNREGQDGNLEAAKGFAFGLNFKYTRSFNFAIFYAFVEIGAGFDVMHAYYPNVSCKGRSGPVGNDGWYSMGQVYGYIYGEFGVKVDLAFIKGQYKIAEAGIAATLQGKFPNPAYFKGWVGMYYSILGGLVSGRMKMKIEFGEECEFVGMSEGIGVPIISDISPSDGNNKVDTFLAPQVVLNYPAGKQFSVQIEGAYKTFKLNLDEFKLTCQGKNIPGEIEWNDNKDVITFKLKGEPLPSEKEVSLRVEVSFLEKVGSSFRVLQQGGKPVTEYREIKFKTDKRPDYIRWQNIVYQYPIKDQRSFHPEEYKTGYVKMGLDQGYLFDSKYEIKAQFKMQSGLTRITDVSYDPQKRIAYFPIPALDLNTPINLDLMVYPRGSEIPSEIVVEESTVDTNTEQGDTSWYNPDTEGTSNMSTVGKTTIANKKIQGEKVSKIAPKSILDYTFRTSQFSTFKEKVRSFQVTDNVTNFIEADQHSLSIVVSDYEYFDLMELRGNKYTGSTPLIFAEALLKDIYYKKTIRPLVYKEYPLDETIKVKRDEAILGIPPVRSFYMSTQYMTNVENNPGSYWVKNRIPFTYNLPYQYLRDMANLKNGLSNKYNDTDQYPVIYEKYKYLLDGSFTAMPLGTYKAKLVYRTPGNMYEKGYEIEFKND